MKYDVFLKRVSRKYKAVTENGETFFFNRDGNVVAHENARKNLLVMYVHYNKMIWCHHNIVAVAIAKDFTLLKNYLVEKADVVVVNGLCGACNTIQRTSNMLLETVVHPKLAFLEYANSHDVSTKFHYIAPMGTLLSPQLIYLDIGLTLDLASLMQSSSSNNGSFDYCNLSYGVLSSKKNDRRPISKTICQKDYHVFHYLKEENSWYWEAGYNTAGSNVTRHQIGLTQYGTNYHRRVKVSCIIRKK
ncbi:MAG: hypothetical protein HFJ28_04480 [Clostridia bacterium]|nr:hypothetical protein [Clostridia bacterium]